MTSNQTPAASRCEAIQPEPQRVQLVRWWEPSGTCRASVLIVHGYGEHSGRYEAVGAQLAGAGLAAWSTDLHGHGQSSGERASVPSLDVLIDDARRVLERARARRPELPLFVLGHSMGGLVATALTLEEQAKIRGLVLSGAALGDPAGLESLLELDPLPEVTIGSELLSRDPEVGRRYDEDPLNYRGPFRRETLRSLTSGARRVRERWDELRLPLLVLHGGDDALVLPASSPELHAAAASSDKELDVLPGLRHEILNEPEGPALTDRIARWILARA
jgi:alpha-beta hydrolase superfamily lysophospholipase